MIIVKHFIKSTPCWLYYFIDRPMDGVYRFLGCDAEYCDRNLQKNRSKLLCPF